MAEKMKVLAHRWRTLPVRVAWLQR